jgi:hypothetical protein
MSSHIAGDQLTPPAATIPVVEKAIAARGPTNEFWIFVGDDRVA